MRTPSSFSSHARSRCGGALARLARAPASRLALALLATGLVGIACGPGGGADAGVQPAFAPTFTNVNGKIFQISCTLSNCHTTGATAAVGNLDLTDNPYLALLGDGGVAAVSIDATNGTVQYNYDGMILVKPGDPDNSLLYLKLNAGLAAVTNCVQTATGACEYGEHMPNVEGETLGPTYVEAVREWIANGALDN